MSPTVAELRDEIREELDVPEWAQRESSFGTRTLEAICERLDRGGVSASSAPMLRKKVREQVARQESEDWQDIRSDDAKPLRKDELVDVRDAIGAEQGGVEA